jgi:hypothetical protein
MRQETEPHASLGRAELESLSLLFAFRDGKARTAASAAALLGFSPDLGAAFGEALMGSVLAAELVVEEPASAPVAYRLGANGAQRLKLAGL